LLQFSPLFLHQLHSETDSQAPLSESNTVGRIKIDRCDVKSLQNKKILKTRVLVVG